MNRYAPRKKGQVSGAQRSAPNASFERTPFATAHGLRPTGVGAANLKPRWQRTSPHCGGVAQLEPR
jgi:hypothetical protein